MDKALPENWRVFSDDEVLATSLVNEIFEISKQAIMDHGAFHFITAGGTTPNKCYQLLSELDSPDIEWHRWHIYMGDERVLEVDDPERNSQALLTNWLSSSKIPSENWHFIRVEQGAKKAAQEYADIVSSIAEFDLCLLGMGEDGHTASLFPGHNEAESVEPIYSESEVTVHTKAAPVIIEKQSPKQPSERVSLNYVVFAKSRLLIKLITGASKKPVLDQWLKQKKPLPISLVTGKTTKVYLTAELVDER